MPARAAAKASRDDFTRRPMQIVRGPTARQLWLNDEPAGIYSTSAGARKFAPPLDSPNVEKPDVRRSRHRPIRWSAASPGKMKELRLGCPQDSAATTQCAWPAPSLGSTRVG